RVGTRASAAQSGRAGGVDGAVDDGAAVRRRTATASRQERLPPWPCASRLNLRLRCSSDCGSGLDLVAEPPRYRPGRDDGRGSARPPRGVERTAVSREVRARRALIFITTKE